MTGKPTADKASSYPQTPPMNADAQRAFLAFARFQEHGIRAVLRYQIEALEFIQNRYQKDIRLMDDLAASAEHGDMFDICTDFIREAISDYGEEAAKLASLESRLASEAAKDIRSETRSIAEDMAVARVA